MHWADFHNEAVWIYKSLVLPSHRGRAIAQALYRVIDGVQGARSQLLLVDGWLAASG